MFSKPVALGPVGPWMPHGRGGGRLCRDPAQCGRPCGERLPGAGPRLSPARRRHRRSPRPRPRSLTIRRPRSRGPRLRRNGPLRVGPRSQLGRKGQSGSSGTSEPRAHTPLPDAHTGCRPLPPRLLSRRAQTAPAAPPPAERPEAPRSAARARRAPQFEEVVLPTSSVIGLQVETALSSERARIEDRVEARVTRDVVADGRVAIPAGSRVIGSVTLVDRGGKVKERARLGIRFHTLVLADGTRGPAEHRADLSRRRVARRRQRQEDRRRGGRRRDPRRHPRRRQGRGDRRRDRRGRRHGGRHGRRSQCRRRSRPASIVTVQLPRPSTVTVERRE